MRVRKFFAAGFVGIGLLAAAATLAPNQLPSSGFRQSDKAAHFLVLFILTTCFYWILETSRRRMIHVTLIVCTAGIGVGSEVLQGLLPNGRIFDPYDILANLLGSGGALIMCAWYHKRMLERKRAARYQMVPGDEGEDHELGVEMRDEEEEVGGTGDHDGPTVTEQLDNWDENAEDWDDHDDTPVSKSKKADDTIMPVSTETDKKATTSE